MLMARGAIVSMLCVIFILPALLMLCDKLIQKTTFDVKAAAGSEEIQMEVI